MNQTPVSSVILQEGLDLTFCANSPVSLFGLFCGASFASGELDCKPVLFSGFLPGIDMLILTRWRASDGIEVLQAQWDEIVIALDGWLDTSDGCLTLIQEGTQIRFYRGQCLMDAAVHLRRQWRVYEGA